MPTSLSRARLGAAVVTAFVCGLLFASGFDLTRFGFAQDGGKNAKVASSQVQSLAETGSAFEAIADHVTPSVVSIQTTRVTQRPLAARRSPRHRGILPQLPAAHAAARAAGGERHRLHRVEGRLHPHQQPRRRRRGQGDGHAARQAQLRGEGDRPRSDDRRRRDQDRRRRTFPSRRSATTTTRASDSGSWRSAIRSASTSP